VRPTVIRKTVSYPPHEYTEVVEPLLQRVPALCRRTTESELVRAGIKLLADMDDEQLGEILDGVERLQPGRPKGWSPKDEQE